MKPLALLWLVVTAAPLAAELVAPADHTGSVGQKAQQVVIVHRAPGEDRPGYQEMLIRLLPGVSGDAPRSLAWIVPVPTEPDHFGTADTEAIQAGTDLHEGMYQLAREQWADRTQLEWPDSLTWMTPRETEPMPVSPFKGKDDDTAGRLEITHAAGVNELAGILTSKGFAWPETSRFVWYEENEFHFLCVLVSPPEGQDSIDTDAGLPPLVVGFETDRAYYPGMLNDKQGNFALDLTLITDAPLATGALEFQRRRLNAYRRGYVHLMNLWTVKGLPSATGAELTDRPEPDRWYVNRIESEAFNEDGDVAEWEGDVFFEPGETRDAVAGFWYYGDTEVSFVERFFREHAIAMIFTFAALLFGSIFIKTRLNRRRLARAGGTDSPDGRPL